MRAKFRYGALQKLFRKTQLERSLNFSPKDHSLQEIGGRQSQPQIIQWIKWK